MSASKVAWRQELQILISCLSLNHREEKQPISCQRAVTAYDQKPPKFCLKQKLSWELFTSFSIILWSKNLSFAGQNKLISIIIWAQKKDKEESNPCAPWVHWHKALRWLVSKCSLIKNKTITQKSFNTDFFDGLYYTVSFQYQRFSLGRSAKKSSGSWSGDSWGS